MQAKETRLDSIIEGTKQYVVPLFQRSYSWTKKEWDILWNDIYDLYEMDNPRVHFFGSIVNMPATSVPEGVAKFLLIDGQQRLTTVFILLSILKDLALEGRKERLSDEIKNTLLLNQYKDGYDHYKMMPTQVDRNAFLKVIEGQGHEADGQIGQAWKYLEKKVRTSNFDIENIKKILTQKFSVVSITLDTDDNPYLVFESLNAKGRSLSQADLIKNYFFMRIHVSKQDEIYSKLWEPMQNNLRDDLSEFIRHYMMRHGGNVRQTDVYYALKDEVSPDNTIDYLKSLNEYSMYYRNMKYPENISDKDLRVRFERLNRIEVTTAYPLILYVYGEFAHNNISKEQFCEVIDVIENYLIRRFVCDYKTNTLNKTFGAAYAFISKYNNDEIVNAVKEYLSTKGYPKDSEFTERFMTTKLYGGGDRQQKTKFILASLEKSFEHKEIVQMDNLTIEHVMPQTLSDWWVDYLGDDAFSIHDIWLHTIGNLTLTAYNSDLSNKSYIQKRSYLSQSHLELNKYFTSAGEWKKLDIEKRAEQLSKRALNIWPYFGHEDIEVDGDTKAYSSPQSVYCLGKYSSVNSWRDVLTFTLNSIYEELPECFSTIVNAFPKWIGKDGSKFRAARELNSGYFIEVNDSANAIYTKCIKVLNVAHLTEDDWSVEYE